jgi:hypothetical protein
MRSTLIRLTVFFISLTIFGYRANAAINRTDRAAFAAHFETLGLFDVENSDGSALPLLKVDQALVSHDLERAIFVKYDVDLGHRFFQGERSFVGKDVVLHGKTLSGRSFAALLHGFNDREVNEVETSLATFIEIRKRKSSVLFNLLLPRACADEPCAVKSSMSKMLTQVVNGVAHDQTVEALMKCGIDAFQRMGSSIEEDANGLRKFVENPAGAFRETVDQFKAIKDIIVNVDAEFANFLKMAPQLSAKLIEKIACTIGGEMMPKLLTSFMGGAAKLAMSIATLVPKLARLASLLRTLGALGKSLPDMNAAIENILNSRLSAGATKFVDRLLEAGKPRAAMGILNCAK